MSYQGMVKLRPGKGAKKERIKRKQFFRNPFNTTPDYDKQGRKQKNHFRDAAKKTFAREMARKKKATISEMETVA